MLKLTNPGLRRFNIVVNSINSCVSDTSKEFFKTPEVCFSKISSKPRMFLNQHLRRKPLKQLKSLTNTHKKGKLNKQIDMINSNIEFINLELSSISNLSNKKPTIHPKPVNLGGVFSIFNFPGKMESILSKVMFYVFQIYFLSPGHSSNSVREFNSEGLVSKLSDTNQLEILNFGDGNYPPNLKVGISSPWM